MKLFFKLLCIVICTKGYAQERIITISGMPSNAPYYYTNSYGEPDGFVPQVAQCIMDDAGLSYKIVSSTMEPMYHYNSITESDVFLHIDDLYMTGVISVKKRATFDYSIPYITLEYYILSPQGTHYCSVSDFAGKTRGYV